MILARSCIFGIRWWAWAMAFSFLFLVWQGAVPSFWVLRHTHAHYTFEAGCESEGQVAFVLFYILLRTSSSSKPRSIEAVCTQTLDLFLDSELDAAARG
jgi:hypothetical protein